MTKGLVLPFGHFNPKSHRGQTLAAVVCRVAAGAARHCRTDLNGQRHAAVSVSAAFAASSGVAVRGT